jgi:hypothetical protein
LIDIVIKINIRKIFNTNNALLIIDIIKDLKRTLHTIIIQFCCQNQISLLMVRHTFKLNLVYDNILSNLYKAIDWGKSTRFYNVSKNGTPIIKYNMIRVYLIVFNIPTRF